MANKKNRWFLPTNTDNLKMMVAQGLISSPDGFSPNKYYKDELENYPGFIPVFKNSIPKDTLELIISEQENMTACLIEIDLVKITQGSAKNQNYEAVDISIDSHNDLLLLLAPLPLSCIKKIVFKSVEDKLSLESEQKLSSNFILSDLKTHYSKADENLFNANIINKGVEFFDKDKEDGNEVKTQTDPVKPVPVNYPRIYAFGGLLVSLFYIAKNGKLSNKIYQDFCTIDKASLDSDKLCIYQYFNQIEDDNILQTMYNKLLDKLISRENSKDDILMLLEGADWGDRFKSRTQDLAQMLRGFEDNETTISEKFSKATKPLERLLLMLFHKESIESLIEYQLDMFTEDDYLLFSLIFGVRDKFIKMPKFVREYQNLQNFISNKMAEYAHSELKSSIKFKSISSPKTVWDILNAKSTAKKAVKKLEITDCVQTVMSGDCQIQGNERIFKGYAEPKYKIIEREYFKIISSKNIGTETYNNLARLK
jgi:hypothetical protein